LDALGSRLDAWYSTNGANHLFFFLGRRSSPNLTSPYCWTNGVDTHYFSRRTISTPKLGRIVSDGSKLCNMRSSQIASSFRRSIHTFRPPSARSLPFAQRHLHLTSPLLQPRRRNFFTSNPFFQQQQQDDVSSDPVRRDGQSPSAPQTKRRPRAAAAKNSLRRVAAIAEQPGGRTSAPAKPGHQTRPRPEEDSAAEGDSSNTIRAVCAAESFNMEQVTQILGRHGFALDPDMTGFESHEVVHARGAGTGDVFVFESGTVVAWGLARRVVDALATDVLAPAAVDPLPADRRETEDLEFVEDGGREASAVRGDVVVLGTRKSDALDTTLAKIAFSSGVARSTKLAALETSLQAYFESTRHIPTLLAQGTTRFPLSRGFILRKTGELLSLRAQLNHYRELTDSLPDLFWDSRSELGLEGYYDQVGRALDVGVRIRTLNEKMGYAHEIATVLREVSSEKHGTRLEWIIILLIAVEVVFELRRVYLERQHPEDQRLVVEGQNDGG
jgi:required for meiotic nuclear division protein 1